jgi:hypothetical protein
MQWANEVSGRVEGSVLQVGVMVGDVHVDAAGPVRSAYLAQVRALTPNALVGRDEELAFLSTFCTSSSTSEGCLWWRAEAWSGKSALLSWFVLHPPPDVRLVSFFVTSRLPGQNNRRGFVENVLDQLYEITGERPRGDLTDSTREPYFLRLLVDVSEQVRRQGKHFALIVDGLDEDCGADGSPDAHSIAALLPRSGVRVIVAGRQDPDLPEDVPADHPLRVSARVEHLSASPKAAAVRDVMIRDLKRLLRGSRVQQDLLGFITAAGGGLSVRDLAELADTSSWQVEDDLRTTAGRSFSRRPGDPPVYILAHEQLHALASEMLRTQLDSYRQKLHAWADAYRARGWPSDTPRYLLQGYSAMLVSLGDRSRLLAHVTDPRRNDAAYSAFGHHNASVGEIEAAQAIFLSEDQSDLTALARLAVHRMSLQESGHWISTSLPEVWAMAGRVEHAELLIAMMGDPVRRARALMATAAELHRGGHTRRAARLLDTAEEMTRAVNQFWGEWLHRELTDAATLIGDQDRARRVAGDVTGATSKARVCASAALAALGVSAREDAEQWYRLAEDALEHRPTGMALFGDKRDRVPPAVFATMASAAAALGYQERAAELAGLVFDPERSFELGSSADVREIAAALTRAGFDDAALSLAGACDSVHDRENMLLRITETMARSGRLSKAEELARTAEHTQYRCARLAMVALVAGWNDDPDRAGRLVTEVEAALDDLPAGDFRRFTVMAIAVAVADAGHGDKAEAAVFAEMLPSGHFGGALSVARGLLRQADTDRAVRILEATEQAARTASPDVDELGLLRWIDVLTDFGDVDRAEPLALSLQDTEISAAAWERIAECLASAGDFDHFTSALSRIARPSLQRRPRLEMIRVLLARGEEGRAAGLARSAPLKTHRAAALALVAERTRDKDLLDEAIGLATDIEDVEEQAMVLLPALRAAANMADRDAAEPLLRRLNTIKTQLTDQSTDPFRYTVTVPGLPERIGTLTDIAERIEHFFDPERHGERPPVVRTGAPPLWTGSRAGSSPRPFREQLARALTIENWLDIVDRVVEIEPDVYLAVAGELDRLHEQGHPGSSSPLYSGIRPSTE